MKTQLITSATGEPIDLEEIKEWCRVEIGETAEDDLLLSLIQTARARAEDITGRKLMPETWYHYLDDWPDCDHITLPLPPLRSVPSSGIVYTDSTAKTLFVQLEKLRFPRMPWRKMVIWLLDFLTTPGTTTLL